MQVRGWRAMIDQQLLSAEIGRLLAVLYAKRFAALERLTLSKLLAKNPYLYRAIGTEKPADFIEQLMLAFVSSSDETIFGNDFLEPLAIFAATQGAESQRNGDRVSVGAGAGQDIAIETANAYLAISVKSSKNIFNSQSEKGQTSEFSALQARLKKINKRFRPIVGYGYGRTTTRGESPVEKLAGQAFWALLSGEEDFYLRIESTMAAFASEHRLAYTQAFRQTNNLLLSQFFANFLAPSGAIDWAALVTFNSATARPTRLKLAKTQD
jgi:hypothetical protein